MLSNLLNRHIIFMKCLVFAKTSMALKALVYKKLLNLSSSCHNENEGEVVNLINVDSTNIALLGFSFTAFVTLPINIIMIIYMILDKDRNSGLAILIITCLFVLFNVYLSIKNGRISKELLGFRDARMKVISDTFSDIKNLKLLGWDEEFLKRVFS